ncbi:hypothetical protein BDW59DRAFT_140074 [Aspergillus cavernicola]|uniref:Uncharacterized protein n=1 Tax=Aspergillus cavernicola TaxID=176166 RepID=A0ABR4IVL1_9EURO
MGPLAWASLRDISILLDKKSCSRTEGVCCCKGKVLAEKDSHFQAAGVLSTWRDRCTQLGTYINKDNQLSIRVACEAASKATAAAFLDALKELPRLKELSIRLGPHRNLELLDMIMEIIEHKTKFLKQAILQE